MFIHFQHMIKESVLKTKLTPSAGVMSALESESELILHFIIQTTATPLK